MQVVTSGSEVVLDLRIYVLQRRIVVTNYWFAYTSCSFEACLHKSQPFPGRLVFNTELLQIRVVKNLNGIRSIRLDIVFAAFVSSPHPQHTLLFAQQTSFIS